MKIFGGSKLFFFIKCNTPLWVIKSYIFFKYRYHFKRRKLRVNRDKFVDQVRQKLTLDHNWFTHAIPLWLIAFSNTGFEASKKIKCLEIGSFQGLSAYFTLNHFSNASLVCVDTWEGADEHRNQEHTTKEILGSIETTFDKNLTVFSERLEKFKGTSLAYFNKHFALDAYDMIYVDGSHHSDDVIVDAVKSFEMLKIGGLLIFDDYFWTYYKRKIDNPAGAINAFLRLKRHQLKIVSFGHQLIVQKISSSER